MVTRCQNVVQISFQISTRAQSQPNNEYLQIARNIAQPTMSSACKCEGLTCEIGVNLERRAEAGLLRRCGSSRGSASVRMRSGIVARIIGRRSPSLLATAPSRPCWTCHGHHSDAAKDGKARQKKMPDLSLSPSPSEIARMRGYCPPGLCSACELDCFPTHSLTPATKQTPSLRRLPGCFRFLPHKEPIVPMSRSELPQ